LIDFILCAQLFGRLLLIGTVLESLEFVYRQRYLGVLPTDRQVSDSIFHPFGLMAVCFPVASSAIAANQAFRERIA